MQAPVPTLHHPIPRLALLFFVGLLTGTLTAPWIGSIHPVLPFLCLLLAGSSFFLSWGRRYPDVTVLRICTAALFLFSFWRGADPVHLHQEREDWIARHLVPLDRPITLTGRVTGSGRTRNGRIWADLANYMASLNDVSTQGRGRIRVYGTSDDDDITDIEIGHQITVEVREVRQSRQRVPHLFDPEAWRLREGFHAEATILSLLAVERRAAIEWIRPFTGLASKIRRQLSRMPLAEPMRSILRAVLTGDRSGLDMETEVNLARSGVAHVMAVSGLHVGLITAPFWWLFMKIRSSWSRFFLWMGTGVVLLLYVEVAHQSPSVSRASLMCWLAGWLVIVFRRMPPTQLLMMAGTILLIWKPLWIRHPGFQLSMVAVWSILLLHAPVERTLRQIVSSDRIRNVLSMVAMTSIIQVALSPFLVWWFGEISIVAPLANLLVVPLVPLLTLSGWSWVVMDGLSLDGRYFLVVSEWIVEWILYCTDHFSDLSWATMTPGYSLWLVLVPALMMSIKGYAWMRDTRHRTLFWYLLSFLLFSGCLDRVTEREELIVTVLDVGQGDAIHIQTPNGYNLMIDTGSKRAAEHVVIPYLNESGVKRLDALLLTHPHADHVGGTFALMDNLSVGEIHRTPWNSNGEWARKLKGSDIPTRRVEGGDRMDLDSSIRIYLLDSFVADSAANNHSLVVKLVYGETSFLLTGDAEHAQESGLARTYGTWLGVDVLKAGHHGSRTSSNRFFLRFVNPSWTVISAGWMNRYGHPHREVLERLNHQGSNFRLTAQAGTIRIVSNGSRIGPVSWN